MWDCFSPSRPPCHPNTLTSQQPSALMETQRENQMSWATALRYSAPTCTNIFLILEPHAILLGVSKNLKRLFRGEGGHFLIYQVTRGTCATHTTNVHPGLPSTTALRSQSKGWSSSTEKIAAEKELGMLTCASQISFLLLAARCSLEVFSLAILLDLA